MQSDDAALSDLTTTGAISRTGVSVITLSADDIRRLNGLLAGEAGARQLSPDLVAGKPWTVNDIGYQMATSADNLTAAAQLDVAWADIVAGLRVTGFISNQGTNWTDWLNCLLAREVLYEAARNWAAHPDQAPARLQQALGDLEEFSIDRWSPEEMLKNRYVVYRQLIEQEGPFWEQIQRHGYVFVSPSGHVATEVYVKSFPWTGERERLRRMMNILTARSLQRSQPDYDYVPANSSVTPRDAEIASWVGTSSAVASEFAVDLWLDVDGRSRVDLQVLRTLSLERGTMLILALQAHRQELGEFPRQISDLVPGVIDDLPRDPYTAGDFGYAPTGFDAPVIPFGNRVVPAQQPLLWSAGLSRAVLAYHAESYLIGEVTVPGDRYVASPLVWSSISPPVSVPHPPDGGTAHAGRIRYLILGVEPPPWNEPPPVPADN